MKLITFFKAGLLYLFVISCGLFSCKKEESYNPFVSYGSMPLVKVVVYNSEGQNITADVNFTNKIKMYLHHSKKTEVLRLNALSNNFFTILIDSPQEKDFSEFEKNEDGSAQRYAYSFATLSFENQQIKLKNKFCHSVVNLKEYATMYGGSSVKITEVENEKGKVISKKTQDEVIQLEFIYQNGKLILKE